MLTAPGRARLSHHIMRTCRTPTWRWPASARVGILGARHCAARPPSTAGQALISDPKAVGQILTSVSRDLNARDLAIARVFLAVGQGAIATSNHLQTYPPVTASDLNAQGNPASPASPGTLPRQQLAPTLMAAAAQATRPEVGARLALLAVHCDRCSIPGHITYASLLRRATGASAGQIQASLPDSLQGADLALCLYSCAQEETGPAMPAGAHCAAALLHHHVLHDFDAASRHYAQALAAGPGHAAAHLGLGLLAGCRGDYAAAQSLLTTVCQAVQRPPGNSSPLVLPDGLPALAEQDASTWDTHTNHMVAADAHFHLACICADHKGLYDEARSHYVAALRHDPVLASGHKALGLMALRVHHCYAD
eukprot:gene9650-1737_t